MEYFISQVLKMSTFKIATIFISVQNTLTPSTTQTAISITFS